MKTSELTGAALDWAVQQCEGARKDIDFVWWTEDYSPSTDWDQARPIIEREQIEIWYRCGGRVIASINGQYEQTVAHYRRGNIVLIAAMRCYVASKLGDEVDVPENVLRS
jgi:hypothetical protein